MDRRLALKLDHFLDLLSQHTALKLYSSFMPLTAVDASSLAELWRSRTSKLSLTRDSVSSLLLTTQSPESVVALRASKNIFDLQSTTNVAKEFFAAEFGPQHAANCYEMLKFFSQYPPKRAPGFNWLEAVDELVASYPREQGSIHQDLQDFLESGPFLSSLATSGIRNHKTRNLLIRKYFGCYLFFVKRLPYKEVAIKTQLSINQLKKSSISFKRGDFSRAYVEGRGQHMRTRRKMTDDKIDWLKSAVRKKTSPFTVQDLTKEFAAAYPEAPVSHTTIFKILKGRLRFRFKAWTLYPAARNSEETRMYRFWYCHRLLASLGTNRLVVSIDETGFSHYAHKSKTWANPDVLPASKLGLFCRSVNVTLILALSQEQVIGFYLFEGAADAVIFADFVWNLTRKIENLYGPQANPMYILDNCRAHKNALVESVFGSKGMEVYFSPPYSPELNYIENYFGILKKRVRGKREFSSK